MLSISHLKKLLKITSHLKKELALATFFGTLGHLAVVFFIFLLAKLFVDKTSHKALFIIILISLALIKGLFAYLEQLLNHYVAFKILHILRLKILEKIKKISISKFLHNKSKDYMTMISNDIEILEVFYAHTITPFLIFISQTVIISLFIAYFNIKLALLTLALYLLMGLILPLISKNKGEILGSKHRKELTKINLASTEEAYGIFENIQYNKLKQAKDNLEKETKSLVNASYQKALFMINLNFINVVIYNMSIIAFIYFANLLISDKIIIVALVCMYIVSFVPTLYMANLASTLSATMAAGKRFIEIMDEKEENFDKGLVVDFNKLEVNNLNFSYQDKPILDNISFEVNKGEILGIYGKSGSGKSTLVKILMKFLETDYSNIKIDGVSLGKIDHTDFRQKTAYIMQDSYLFNASLANNISLFDENLDKTKLEKVLKETNLYDFVNQLPNKTDEIISEKSSNISTGQKQRIATARALYADAKIIILDEATSNIDVFSEIEILKTLERIKKDKIIILISHSKSTLSICDKLLRMEK